MMDYIATEKTPKQNKKKNIEYIFIYYKEGCVCVCKSGKELYIPLKEKK